MHNGLIIVLFTVYGCYSSQSIYEYTNFYDALRTPKKVKVLILNTCSNLKRVENLEEIHLMENLIKLEISECPKVKTIPKSIVKLQNLKSLSFYWNGGVSINDWAKEFKTIIQLSQLEELNLGPYNDIGNLSPLIGKLENLKKLNLNKTQTQSLPKEMGKLKKLEILDISMTPIRNVPIELFELHNLKKIIIRGSQLANDNSKVEKLRNALPNCEIIF